MRLLPSSAGALVAFLVAWLAFPRRSLAYIDPGTGSYLLQLLFAAVLGGLFALKLFWARVKAIIGGLFSKAGDDSQEVDGGSQADEDSQEADSDSKADGDEEP